MAELEPGSPEPETGVPYEVQIITDTNLSDPAKGKFVVRILHKDLDVPLAMKRKELTPAMPEKITAIQETPDGGHVLILETELPINAEGGPHVPRAEDFRHFTIDARTVQTLEKIATAVELRQPCLLEGETATSKTSSIEYMAMRTNTPVMRLNLNGQTDTSELIGKYVPNDGQLAMDFEQALKHHADRLSAPLKVRLEQARKEDRPLDLVESQLLAQELGLKIPEWRWQDGKVPLAMKTGAWLILDEMNLAEPQILERLNSLLERYPSLTLSEHAGETIRPGGDFETHDRFRFFATMNPASYEGRKKLSAAFKNRLLAYLFVDMPVESDYTAMMNLMVYGEQPKIKVRGVEYASENVEPLFKVVGQVEGMRGLLPKIGKFHAQLEIMSRERTIGKSNPEPYVITRRELTGFLDYLENKSFTDRHSGKRYTVVDNPKALVLRAIQFYYLDKITNADDRKKVNDLLDAIGISESRWTHVFPATEKPKAPEVRVGEVYLNATLKSRSPRGLIFDLGIGREAVMSIGDGAGIVEENKKYPVRVVDIDMTGQIQVVPHKEKKIEHEPAAGTGRIRSVRNTGITAPEETAPALRKPEDIRVGEVFSAKIDVKGPLCTMVQLEPGIRGQLKLSAERVNELVRLAGSDVLRVKVTSNQPIGPIEVEALDLPEKLRVPLKKEEISVGDIFTNVEVTHVEHDRAVIRLEPGGLEAIIMLDSSLDVNDMRDMIHAGETLARVRISKKSGPIIYAIIDMSEVVTVEMPEEAIAPRKPVDVATLGAMIKEKLAESKGKEPKVGEVFNDAEITDVQDDKLTLTSDGQELAVFLIDYNRGLPLGGQLRDFSGVFEVGRKFPIAVRAISVFGDTVYCEPIRETAPIETKPLLERLRDAMTERKTAEPKVGEVYPDAEIVDNEYPDAIFQLRPGVTGRFAQHDLNLEIGDRRGVRVTRVESDGTVRLELTPRGSAKAAKKSEAPKPAATLGELIREKSPSLFKGEIKVGEEYRDVPVVSVNSSEAVFNLPGGERGVMTSMDYRSSKISRSAIVKSTDLHEVISVGRKVKVKVISIGRDECRVVMVD